MWEKIFPAHLTDTSLLSTIRKQHPQINNKRTDSPVEKAQKFEKAF